MQREQAVVNRGETAKPRRRHCEINFDMPHPRAIYVEQSPLLLPGVQNWLHMPLVIEVEGEKWQRKDTRDSTHTQDATKRAPASTKWLTTFPHTRTRDSEPCQLTEPNRQSSKSQGVYVVHAYDTFSSYFESLRRVCKMTKQSRDPAPDSCPRRYLVFSYVQAFSFCNVRPTAQNLDSQAARFPLQSLAAIYSIQNDCSRWLQPSGLSRHVDQNCALSLSRNH